VPSAMAAVPKESLSVPAHAPFAMSFCLSTGTPAERRSTTGRATTRESGDSSTHGKEHC
jgi:hypothetical protein